MRYDVSPEADRWLNEAREDFNRKQSSLQATWIRQFQRWEFDPTTGVLTLTQPDGTRSIATAEVLGSFSPADQTWEWAWNNPNMPAKFSQRSLALKEVGQRFGLEYLTLGVVPLPDNGEEMSLYLCSLAPKATGAAGIFRGGDDRLPVFFLVFDPTCIER